MAGSSGLLVPWPGASTRIFECGGGVESSAVRVANLPQNTLKIGKTPDFGRFILESGGGGEGRNHRFSKVRRSGPPDPPVGDAPGPGTHNFPGIKTVCGHDGVSVRAQGRLTLSGQFRGECVKRRVNLDTQKCHQRHLTPSDGYLCLERGNLLARAFHSPIFTPSEIRMLSKYPKDT